MNHENTVILFKKEDLKRCYYFSESIISSSNQYNRFSKTNRIQIERTFAGKLGEYGFLLFLKQKGISYPEGAMFEVFEGKSNVDAFDFKTLKGKTLDIKVASKPFHSRIMVPIDQFNLKKDYYVGIKLNFKTDSKDQLILNTVNKAEIHGYCLREEMEKTQTKNFGEGPCKHFLLKDLHSISNIFNEML